MPKRPADARAVLRATMQAHGITQAELSRRAGVTQANVSDFLAGKSDVVTATYNRMLAACATPTKRAK